jgi:signal transduction histidine kinase
MPLNSSSRSIDLNCSDLFLEALECLPEPIVLAQPEGTMIYGNRAAHRLFSVVMGQSLRSYVGDQDWSIIGDRVGHEDCLNPEEPEVILSLGEGLQTPMAIAVRRMADGLWLWRFRDLTRQRQRELEWSAENTLLARSSQHKSAFLSNMSHELRTPLTSILGFSSILKQQIFGTLNLKQEIYMQQIHRSGQHLLALINDILDLSKIEAGQMILEKSHLTVRSMCEEAIALVQSQAKARDIQIKLTIVAPIKFLYADELRVRQMLLNLLSNAIKFSPESGIIRVKVSREGVCVHLAVMDQGHGIPLDKQDLIFKPFQQVDESRDRRSQGTGLGLALTRQMAELHGGTVTVESEVGVGSCFVLRLPEGEK